MVYDQQTSQVTFFHQEVECPELVEGQYVIYILECSNHSYYCGCTGNLENRLQEHRSGEGAKWTLKYQPFQLVHVSYFSSLLEARQRERQIKGWTRAKKEKLISGDWK